MSEIKINEATGLPEVAEDYFWEVSKSEHTYRMTDYYVTLYRRPTKKYGNKFQRYWDDAGKYNDKTIDSCDFEMTDVMKQAKEKDMTLEESVRDFIKRAAGKIIKRQQARLTRAEALEIASKFEGTYPPKNIND